MLPQNTQKQADSVPQLANPFQLEVAKALSKDLAVLQKNQLLTADILNKLGDLSKLEADIVAKYPNARERTEFVIKIFLWLLQIELSEVLMADFIFPIIVAVILGFIAGMIIFAVYTFSKTSKKQKVNSTLRKIPPVYTDEEIALAQFLEDRQAINEAFLSAQMELLKLFLIQVEHLGFRCCFEGWLTHSH